jgi:hypothetical protein
MFKNKINLKGQGKNALKISFALIFSALFLTLALFFVTATPEDGVQYTVIEDLPNELELDKTYTMKVNCTNVDTMPYEVWAEITITGPDDFNNRDIFIVWTTYDDEENLLTQFTLGRDGTQQFTGKDTITWTGTRTLMMPGDYHIHMLNVTVLGSAPLGNYKAVVTVWGEETPIEAQVKITPETLNVKSRGRWITAYIFLPEPYKPEDIGVSSVKLLYNDDSVQVAWGNVEDGCLMVKFSRSEVTKMLGDKKGPVELTVTGLVNGVEFYGTDTITIIGP